MHADVDTVKLWSELPCARTGSWSFRANSYSCLHVWYEAVVAIDDLHQHGSFCHVSTTNQHRVPKWQEHAMDRAHGCNSSARRNLYQ